MDKDSKTGHTIVIATLTILVVVLGLLDVRLFRENSNTVNGAKTYVENILNNAITNNSVNTVSNTAVNNTVNNSTNATNTISNNTTNSSGTSQTPTGAPFVVSSSPGSDEKVSGDGVAFVSVTFNTALDASSTLSVTRNIYPQHVGTGVTTFSSDKNTMKLSVNATTDDKYTIHYTACTGENTNCSTGSIIFTVGTGNVKEARPSNTTNSTK